MCVHFIRILCVACLFGCKKQVEESLIYNPMLLQNTPAGRLWLFDYPNGKNPRYIWFSPYGNFHFLEFDIAETETYTFIPNEKHWLNGH
jgi:hypothetical protein